MAYLKALFHVVYFVRYLNSLQYHYLKQHQPFVIKGQSGFDPRIWPLIVNLTATS